VEPSPLLLLPFIGLLYQPWMIDDDDCGAIIGMNDWQGKKEYPEEMCPQCRSLPQSTCDLSRARTRGHRCRNSATDRLSYGTAYGLNNLIKFSYPIGSQIRDPQVCNNAPTTTPRQAGRSAVGTAPTGLGSVPVIRCHSDVL
jgi:hypothetical protein